MDTEALRLLVPHNGVLVAHPLLSVRFSALCTPAFPRFHGVSDVFRDATPNPFERRQIKAFMIEEKKRLSIKEIAANVV